MATAVVTGDVYAQKCATDEMHKYYKEQHPEIAEFEKQVDQGIAAFMAKQKLPNVAAKTTAVHNDTDYYDIPVVVHFMHNFGSEWVKDSDAYALIDHLNQFYNKQNADLSAVIQPFKKYVGNAKIRFHLATKDPNGNPTKGITRRLTYLTYGGDDNVKMDQWPPHSYLNIWFENKIGRSPSSGTILAYSTFPSSAASFPYSDGIIAGAPYIHFERTLEHEIGHYFDLLHTWNSSGEDAGTACGDDGVDDTPPTKGHFSTCPLYDTACAANYYKIYTSASGLADSLVNLPDTTNTQNTMDYSNCTNMFTIGQVWRMRAALNSDIGGRKNLWDSSNLAATGALAPMPDLTPIAEFSSKSSGAATAPLMYFTYPGVNLTFQNRSWRDTITEVKWSFSNSAASPNLTHTTFAQKTLSFNNSFAESGWVDVKMDVTGNNSGTTSTTFEDAIFVADAAGVNPLGGYMQDFADGGDRNKWPMFNYYNNGFKWKYANYGVYDNSCVMYQGFDTRTGLDLLTGSPRGDFDDMYSIPFDLSAMTGGPCNLNFHFAGATRTSSAENITDTLFIEYSVGKSLNFVPMAALTKSTLSNKGAMSTAFAPTSVLDWEPMTINIPAGARTNYTVFRFRYKPGTFKATTTNPGTMSTGNNYYMDRIHISPWPAGVSDVKLGNIDVKVIPNPTQGDAYVLVKDINSNKADITVTDITGKVVYTTSEALNGHAARIMIPASVIATKGVYLVQTSTGSQSNTQKLVVY